MQADAGETFRLLPQDIIGIDRLFQGGIRIALRCPWRRVRACAMRRAGAGGGYRKDQQAGQRRRPRSDRPEITGLDCL